MASIVSQSKPVDQIANELVARAVDNDGDDNTTAMVIKIRAVEQVSLHRGRPYST
jgi:serine/threonine protein phosphatase PrpC